MINVLILTDLIFGIFFWGVFFFCVFLPHTNCACGTLKTLQPELIAFLQTGKSV